MKKTEYFCDVHICSNKAILKEHPTQVIFITEQTEGRACKPYFSNEKLDLCDRCAKIMLKGFYLHAEGAQGHNTYFFGNPIVALLKETLDSVCLSYDHMYGLMKEDERESLKSMIMDVATAIGKELP